MKTRDLTRTHLWYLTLPSLLLGACVEDSIEGDPAIDAGGRSLDGSRDTGSSTHALGPDLDASAATSSLHPSSTSPRTDGSSSGSNVGPSIDSSSSPRGVGPRDRTSEDSPIQTTELVPDASSRPDVDTSATGPGDTPSVTTAPSSNTEGAFDGTTFSEGTAATSNERPTSTEVNTETSGGELNSDCGDGLVRAGEQCDDHNVDSNDGCTANCLVQWGYQCSGQPSVCARTTCGDGVRAGTEGCDDGNTDPNDGCSPFCSVEPHCSGDSCTSVCGDGLVLGEACDDGNTDPGDGCSSTCTVETGYECAEGSCETVDGQCVLRVGVVYRDFSVFDADFGISVEEQQCGIPEDAPIEAGLAAPHLDADGRPRAGTLHPEACVESAESFARWFRDGYVSRGELTLFDNAEGRYVNRFGERGEQLVRTLRTSNEQQVPLATSKATCEYGCQTRARGALQCENYCRPAHDAVLALTDLVDERTTERDELLSQLAIAEAAQPPDPERVALLQQELEVASEQLQVAIEGRAAQVDAAAECETTCSAEFDTLVNTCVDDCKPCSFNSSTWCTGGLYAHYDGTPLFFPVDGLTTDEDELSYAALPPQYGFAGWPREEDEFAVSQDHNFNFTVELQHWFRYDANRSHTLSFVSDDDLFVFINGYLALDLGGLHVPTAGTVTLDAAHAESWGLQHNGVYLLSLFKAERKLNGSSFTLTLPQPAFGASKCLPAP